MREYFGRESGERNGSIETYKSIQTSPLKNRRCVQNKLAEAGRQDERSCKPQTEIKTASQHSEEKTAHQRKLNTHIQHDTRDTSSHFPYGS